MNEIMINRRRCIGTALSLLGITACTAPLTPKSSKPSLAITIDDFNVQPTPLYTAMEGDTRIRQALKIYGLRAAAFPSAKYAIHPNVQQALFLWAKDGHVIGNHTYEHAYFNGESAKRHMDDILRAEAILNKFSTYKKWFRFPFLSEGRTAEGRDEMRRLLQDSGYINAHVTIDTSDWYIANRLKQRLENNAKADITAYRNFYLKHLFERAQYYDGLAEALTGRKNTRHTLLLHYNCTSALFLSDALAMFQSKGWRLENIDMTYKDLLYKNSPSSLPAGQSLIWAMAKADGGYESKLRYPAEDKRYEEKEALALGL